MDRKIGKRIMFLSRHHQAYINHLLKDSDFTYAQFNVLRVLKDEDGITQDTLVRKLLIDKARVSRVVQQLEEKGYIHKKSSSIDKRQTCLYISEQGKIQLPKVQSILQKSSDLMLDGLDETTIEQVLKVLDMMCQNVAKGDYLDE